MMIETWQSERPSMSLCVQVEDSGVNWSGVTSQIVVVCNVVPATSIVLVSLTTDQSINPTDHPSSKVIFINIDLEKVFF